MVTWGAYCLSTGITVAAIKVINLALHVMYDQAQILPDTSLKKSDKALRETAGFVTLFICGEQSLELWHLPHFLSILQQGGWWN